MFDSNTDFILFAVSLLGISLFVSLGLTRLMLLLLPKWGMVDKPDFQRHIHTISTPRGGGIGMAIAFFGVSFSFFLLFPHTQEVSREVIRILIPIGVLLPLGILDDKRGLKAGIKFFFQIVTASLTWILGLRMTSLFGWELPTWASFIFTVLWIAALINAFNMIDGVDGLAGGIACISALCMAFIALTKGYQDVACFLVIFMGTLLGFLFFNWYPAKIFMGDTGSMFIGYILAVTGIGLNARLLSVASIGVPLLACGIPVLDICLAIWRRLFDPEALKALECADDPRDDSENASSSLPPQNLHPQKKSLLRRLATADRCHLHHRFLNIFNNNQTKVVRRIYIIAGAMGGIAILSALIPGQNKILALTLIIGTFSVVISRLATLELWNSAETVFHNFHSARMGLLLSHIINPVFDLAVIILASYLANKGTPLCFPQCLLTHVTIVMAVMIFSRNYRTLWNYSISDDYFRLICTLCIGYYLSWLVSYFLFKFVPDEHFLAGAGVAVAAILGERLLFHFIRNYIIFCRNNSKLTQDDVVINTVIVGISPVARFYRDSLFSHVERAGHEQLLGIIDQQRRFCHSYVYGMKVLGTSEDLEALYQKKPFQKIIVTLPPTAGQLSRLQDFAHAHAISLTLFTVSENGVYPPHRPSACTNSKDPSRRDEEPR